MQGRKPTPSKLIKASDFKKSEDEILERQEVEQSLLTTAKLRCPARLSKEAKKEWKRLMDLYKLMDARILCDLDIQLISMFCEATAIYKKAQETWVKYESVIATNPEAQRILDKCLSVMNQQSSNIRGLSEQLCLSPVGRARMGLNAIKKEKKDELSQLFADDE